MTYIGSYLMKMPKESKRRSSKLKIFKESKRRTLRIQEAKA